MHTLLDFRGSIPVFIHISDGNMLEVNLMHILVLEPRAFYMMDRGYVDFARLFHMYQECDLFVTRVKSNIYARHVCSAKVGRSSGIICDLTIALKGRYISKECPKHVRHIRFKEPETQQTLVFLCKNTSLPHLTIATLYKSR